MNDFGERLLAGWVITDWCSYIACAFVATLLIRLVATFLAAWEAHWLLQPGMDTLWAKFRRRYVGVKSRSKEGPPDYWFASLLGFLELLTFPILMISHAWVVIGGWLTFKTVAQWEAWKTNRNTFNRFLIATALMLIVAYAMARYFVTKKFNLI